MNGYILESRRILESDIWSKPPMYFKVWHYLLLNAQYTEYRGMKRGQLFTSINDIREACAYYVGYRKVVPTKKEIWGIINWLRNPHEGDIERNDESTMIKTTKGTHGMLVTICNFNYYQNPSNYERNTESVTKGTKKELRKERQGNNINKENKEREERKNNARACEGETPRGADDRKVIPMPDDVRKKWKDYMGG